MTYSLHEATARLSELVKLSEAGEEIEISRHGTARADARSNAAIRQELGCAA